MPVIINPLCPVCGKRRGGKNPPDHSKCHEQTKKKYEQYNNPKEKKKVKLKKSFIDYLTEL